MPNFLRLKHHLQWQWLLGRVADPTCMFTEPIRCAALDELYAEPLIGRTGKTFDNHGALSTPNNLAALRNFMMTEKPKQTLEIGLGFGGSCLALAAMHRELGEQGVCHVAIDPFQDSFWDGIARIYLERASLTSAVEILCEHSAIALARLLAEGRHFGLIYIDGSHLFEDVFVDVYFAWKLLTPGGVVLVDDSTDPHVQKVIKFVKRNLADSLQQTEIPGKSVVKRAAQTLFGRQQLTALRRVNAAERKWDARFSEF